MTDEQSLRNTPAAIAAHLRSIEQTSVEIDDDYDWDVPLRDRYDVAKDPEWDSGSKWHISLEEGHHRMAAALEIAKETGNCAYVNQLLQNGAFRSAEAPALSGPLSYR